MKLFVKENELIDAFVPANTIMNQLYDSNEIVITTHSYNLFSKLVEHPKILFRHPEWKRSDMLASPLSSVVLSQSLERMEKSMDLLASGQCDDYRIIVLIEHRVLDLPQLHVCIPDRGLLNVLFRNKLIDEFLLETE